MDNQKFMWQDRYNIGVESIDREHRKLFSVISKLFAYEGNNDEKSRWAYQEGIKYFKGHAMKHFAEEEMYMVSIGYEGYEAHRRLHDIFRTKTLPEIEKELAMTHYSPEAVQHFLGVCAGWLIGHTMTEDRAIVGGISSRWDDLVAEEEQNIMKKTFIELTYEVFQLQARLISESYGGEKFGDGVYYRVVYGSDTGEKWEFFLVFEERLILGTVGNIVDTDAEKLNATMLNATRYVSRQMLEQLIKRMNIKGRLEVKEENLLSYKQFDRMFQQHNPQYSLLFDTGKGYCALCVVAKHLLEEDSGITINADNAMTELQKYLAEKEKENVGKKRILIVDDSAVILQVMKELLDQDYEVLTAKSGLSAIRSMTLDRPDLVLLDYEMPVCDGKQILEMIRADDSLADVPVIFLTGSTDKERIKSIIPLKPAGDMLKTLKPQEIKKNVDEFFEKRAR